MEQLLDITQGLILLNQICNLHMIIKHSKIRMFCPEFSSESKANRTLRPDTSNQGCGPINDKLSEAERIRLFSILVLDYWRHHSRSGVDSTHPTIAFACSPPYIFTTTQPILN